MKTLEKIEIIKKLKIYEQKFGFDEKLQKAQEKIALANDEEMKKLFADYIEGADRDFLFEKRMTVEEAVKKSAEQEVIENFLGPIALGDDPVDADVDKPVFIDNFSASTEPVAPPSQPATPPVNSFSVLMSQASGEKLQDKNDKSIEEEVFKLTADEFENSDKFTLNKSDDEFVSGADKYEESIEERRRKAAINAVSEEERIKKASDMVAQMGGEDKKPEPEKEQPKKPEPAKKYLSSKSSKGSGSTTSAVINAAVFGLIGCAASAALFFFLNILSGWVAVLTAFIAGVGYKKVKGEMDKTGYIVVSVVTVLEMVLTLFVCYGISTMEMFTCPTLIEGIKFVFEYFMQAFLTDLAMTVVFSVVGVIVYFTTQKKKN